MTKNNIKKVLIDADVLSHFIANNKLDLLPIILDEYDCIILDYVYNEIARVNMRKLFLDSEIKKGKIEKICFPTDNVEMIKEFALIKKNNKLIGGGERACMAYARSSKDIIASSNFRDIAKYCKENRIEFIGFLDILLIALSKEILTVIQCNEFMKNAVLYNKARIPEGVKTIIDYQIYKSKQK